MPPVCFYYAFVTLLLRSHFDNEDLATLSLRWWRCSCDLATTLAMELRFRCAFVSCLYRNWNSDTLLLRPFALLPLLLRFVSFWPKFRIVAESPPRGMGILLRNLNACFGAVSLRRFFCISIRVYKEIGVQHAHRCRITKAYTKTKFQTKTYTSTRGISFGLNLIFVYAGYARMGAY